MQPSDQYLIPPGLFGIYREPGLTHAKESDDLDPDFHGYRNLQNGHKIFDGLDSFYLLMNPYKSIGLQLPTARSDHHPILLPSQSEIQLGH